MTLTAARHVEATALMSERRAALGEKPTTVRAIHVPRAGARAAASSGSTAASSGSTGIARLVRRVFRVTGVAGEVARAGRAGAIAVRRPRARLTAHWIASHARIGRDASRAAVDDAHFLPG